MISDRITMGHGSGGKLMSQLIREHIAPIFGMDTLGDSAALDLSYTAGSRLAFTTDSYVVSPLFFPGGDIGDLAVNGTVNDLAMVGAKPLWLSAGFVIEEGFDFESLKRILKSMSSAALNAGVKIVTGDTKVVNKGKGDGIFINTSGVGIVPPDINLGASMIRPGDHIVISGHIGRHGVAVMAERNGISFDPPTLSDTAPLADLVGFMLGFEKNIRIMRDPTRGGVATTLKELALESGLTAVIYEEKLPIPGGVKGACELLGLDPLYVANEGILLAIVPSSSSDELVEVMKKHKYGSGATVIGEIAEAEKGRKGMVLLKTVAGGTRIIDMLAGEQLPRIC